MAEIAIPSARPHTDESFLAYHQRRAVSRLRREGELFVRMGYGTGYFTSGIIELDGQSGLLLSFNVRSKPAGPGGIGIYLQGKDPSVGTWSGSIGGANVLVSTVTPLGVSWQAFGPRVTDNGGWRINCLLPRYVRVQLDGVGSYGPWGAGGIWDMSVGYTVVS